MTPKVKTLRDQAIELHKFKYDKIQNGDPIIVSDKLFEETFRPLLYKYKDKLLNRISYDLLVCGINSTTGKTRAPLGNKLMNYYCDLEKRYLATLGIVSEVFNRYAWNNIQQISK